MSQTFTKPNTGSGGDNEYEGFVKINDCLDALHSNFYGSSAPGSVTNGMIWVDSTTTTDLVPKLRENGAFVTLDMKTKLFANKDFNNFQATNFRFENKATTPASMATTAGRIVYNTATGDLIFDDNSVSGGMRKLVAVEDQVGSLAFQPIDRWTLGSTPPTASTIGTTPVVAGYLFDAAGETMSLSWVVPTNWIGDSDVTLDLFVLLVASETTGDDIDWSCDWVSMTPSIGVASGTSTAASASTTDIGGGTSLGTLHKCSIIIDHDDATNGFSAGDVVAFEIHRTDLAQVAGVILINAGVSYYRDDI